MKWLHQVGAGLLLASALGLCAEIAARLAGLRPRAAVTTLRYEIDPLAGPFALGSQLARSRAACYEVSGIHTNRFGMRDRDRSLSATGPRIAMVGDSFLQGLQVADEETVSRQLEARLSGGEVLNFGAAATGTAAQLLSYRKRVRPFHPDAVLLLFFPGNDPAENLPELLRQANPPMAALSPYFLLDEGGRLREDPAPGRFRRTSLLVSALNGTTLGQLAYTAVSAAALRRERGEAERVGAASERGGAGGGPEAVALSERAWSVTEQVLARFSREVAADGGHFAVVIVPVGEDLARGTAEAAARIGAVALRESFPVLDLATYLAARRPGLRAADLRHPCDEHWSARGHALAASAIAEFLRGQGWVEG